MRPSSFLSAVRLVGLSAGLNLFALSCTSEPSSPPGGSTGGSVATGGKGGGGGTGGTGGTEGGTTGGQGGSGGVGGIVDSGNDSSVPFLNREDNYATVPCYFPSDIDSFVIGGQEKLIGACPGGQVPGGGQDPNNHLFEIDPSRVERPIQATKLVDNFPVSSTQKLDSVAFLSPDRAIVTASDLAGDHGFFEVSLNASFVPRFFRLPSGKTFGGGPIVSQNKLMIPTSNLYSSFTTGCLIFYDLLPDGSVNGASERNIPTTKANAAGTALLGGELLVLDAGDYTSASSAAIDRIDIQSEGIIGTIDLGNLTASPAAELALTPDGKTAVIGTADSSGDLLFVDLQQGTATKKNIGGSFHSSVKIRDDWAYVTDFNSGILQVVRLSDQTVVDSFDLNTTEAGPSEIIPEGLIQLLPNRGVRIY